MEQKKASIQKIWITIGLLALCIALTILLDTLPLFKQVSTQPSVDQPSKSPVDAELYKGITYPDAGTVRLSFIGECAPGSPFGTSTYGSLNTVAENEGTAYFFSELKKFFEIDHLTVASNACIFSDSPAVWQTSSTAAPAGNATIYTDGGIDLIADINPVSASSKETEDALSTAGLLRVPKEDIYSFEEYGIKVNICTASLSKTTPTEPLLDMIAVAKGDADYVVLYFYAGERNSHQPEEWLTNLLYACADAGASLIVGTGNGVLRPMEVYKETVIAYSLGEMVNGAALVCENATLVLEVDLSLSETGELKQEVKYIPCYAYENLWQPVAMEDSQDVLKVQAFLDGEAMLPVGDSQE